MAKRNFFTTVLGRFAYGSVAKADTEAPKGATWKPDGKFKATVVIDPEALEAAVIAAAEEAGFDPNAEGFYRPYEAANVDKYPEDAGLVTFTAKSKFRPKLYDGRDTLIPTTTRDAEGKEVDLPMATIIQRVPKGGDQTRMRVELNPFEKTEKVRENGKMVDVKIQGVSARLVAIQIAKRGGGGGGFGAVEDGWSSADEGSSRDYDMGTDEAPEDGASGADF